MYHLQWDYGVYINCVGNINHRQIHYLIHRYRGSKYIQYSLMWIVKQTNKQTWRSYSFFAIQNTLSIMASFSWNETLGWMALKECQSSVFSTQSKLKYVDNFDNYRSHQNISDKTFSKTVANGFVFRINRIKHLLEDLEMSFIPSFED